MTLHHGIPITTPARTLVDLSGCARGRELEQALAQAERSGLATRDHIRALLTRHARRPGTRALRELLHHAEPAFLRSEAEARFLSLIRRAQLEKPVANARAAGHEVDFLWPGARLVVEIDGYAFHSDAGAFERDRRRDAELTGAGMRVMRITWRQLSREPEAVLVRVARALSCSEV
jgi:very-short-patch-repair endonuclease